MSCGPVDSKFRLLDAYVGWDLDAGGVDGLTGFDDPAGLRLALQHPGAVSAEVWSYLLPPRLARGCGACDWYLLAESALLRRQACEPGWRPLWRAACVPQGFKETLAVAAWQQRLALAEPNRVRLWQHGGALPSVEIAVAGIAAIGYTACGALLVATARAVLRFGPSGEQLARPLLMPEGSARPEAVVGDDADGVWLVTRDAGGELALLHAAHGAQRLLPAGIEALRTAALAPTGLTQVSDAGFCLAETGRDGSPRSTCWRWNGQAAASGELGAAAVPALRSAATLLTRAIDSGLPHCRWHRVRLDADLPVGSSLSVRVISAEEPDAPLDQADWQTATPGGALDFLIDQPPGRYLRLGIVFGGDGRVTPVLRRVRLDFPRATSLDRLPPVFRENRRAEDFSERFLSLFDASIADLDAAIVQFPALLDIDTTRSELLPWLAGFLDLRFDPAWEPARQRRILAALPRLYRLRGTVAGLKLAVRLVFDAEVEVRELAFERAWGALGAQDGSDGSAALGRVRLFGKSKARFTLGRSGLSAAPLRSRGNPDLDPLSTGAYRFQVLAPPGPLQTGLSSERLARLVESQKPAHTQADVRRIGGRGFVIGATAAVGIDSVLAGLPAPVLGQAGNVRLGRMSVLWSARRGAHSPFLLGAPLVLGIQTVLE